MYYCALCHYYVIVFYVGDIIAHACFLVCCCLVYCMKISLVDNKTYPSKSAKSQH